MTHARSPLPQTLRLLALVAALFAPTAWADDYGDVSQLLRSGKLPEALTKADQYLASKPRDPQMRFLKGVIQTEVGRPSDAISTFSKLTEDYPELPEPYNNLAVLYAGQSQFDKARAALEMAIRTNPSYATAHENLGDVYAKLASQAYSKALQLDAGNTAVQPKLALIRDLFSSPASKASAQRPAAAAPAAPTAPVVAAKSPAPLPPASPAPAPAVVAQAPAPAPRPAPAPPPPAVSTPVAAATRPAASLPASVPASSAAATAAAQPTSASTSSAATRDVEAAVRAWAAAWSGKDVPAYLGAYGKEFDPPGNQSRKSWEDERRSRIVGKSHINVRVSDMAVSVNGSKALVKFKQAYSADALNVSSRKTLELHKSGDRWLIVRESTGA